jgi:hypothetical protein
MNGFQNGSMKNPVVDTKPLSKAGGAEQTKSPARSPVRKSPSNAAPTLAPSSSTSKGAGNELAEKLRKRAEKSEPVLSSTKMEAKCLSWALNASAEFRDFSRQEIEDLTIAFQAVDTDNNGMIGLSELKKLLERLGHPQTHAALSAMTKEVDVDHDGQISLREFIAIYKKSRKGPLQDYQGLHDMTGNTESIDVSQVGVGGAKSFFESKAKDLHRSDEVVEEVKAQHASRRITLAETVQRRMEFKEKMNKFKQGTA